MLLLVAAQPQALPPTRMSVRHVRTTIEAVAQLKGTDSILNDSLQLVILVNDQIGEYTELVDTLRSYKAHLNIYLIDPHQSSQSAYAQGLTGITSHWPDPSELQTWFSAAALQPTALRTHDALTQLANQAYFNRQAEHEIAYALRHQQPLSMLLIQPETETSLRYVASHLQRQLRLEDLLARIDADTFGVLLRGTQQVDAHRIAERLLLKDVPFAVAVGQLPLSEDDVTVVYNQWLQQMQIVLQQALLTVQQTKQSLISTIEAAPAPAVFNSQQLNQWLQQPQQHENQVFEHLKPLLARYPHWLTDAQRRKL